MGKGGHAAKALTSAREHGDAIAKRFCDFFAKHGWALVVVLVVWYNLHDPVKRRLAKWKK